MLQTSYVLKTEILQFLSLKSTAYKQEWLQIESGLLWRTYGICLLITGNSNNPTWNGKPCASPVSLSRFHTCVVGKSLLCMRGGWVLPAKQKVKALCFLQKQQYERNRRPERRYERGKSMYYVILFLDPLSFCLICGPVATQVAGA